ncbi:Der1-like family-domain-containing protein [Paraphoma chrysanthemicola]|uniref:Derlin n=1 Tax=Paraphoma chrysanthemicola TaxID=798071 RepID=A0A8K0R4N5_9PLEO|nr:Der1-like family-domain-containing protein [Paraphoma chrysanthemicola]
MDVFWTLPPVTRTISALAVVVSAAGYGGIISLSQYVFFSPFVFTTKMWPQIWRLFSAFLITKPKFAILLDPYFCYQYGSAIERESSRFAQPGDFFTYTAFVASVIVVSTSNIHLHLQILAEAVPGIEGEYPCTSRRSVIRIIQIGTRVPFVDTAIPLGGYGSLHTNTYLLLVSIMYGTIANTQKALAGYGLNTYTFLPALSLAYAYTFAQENPTRQVSFFIITFDSKYLPFALLFMTFIMDSPSDAAAQLTGLIAAHLYDFLTRIWPTFGGGRNIIFTPQIVKQWFGAGGAGTVQNRGYGYAVQGRGRATGTGAGAPDAAAAGRSTGSSNTWGSVGPGRRLGGE